MFDFLKKFFKDTGIEVVKEQSCKGVCEETGQGIDIGTAPGRQVTGEKSHLVNALDQMNDDQKQFISLKDNEYAKIVSFHIQSDPISEVGVNGVQVHDLIEYSMHLLKSLNDKFHSPYNDNAISRLEIALSQLEMRTKDRVARKVEGFNQE